MRQKTAPPELALRILNRLLPPDRRADVAGDLHEEFLRRQSRQGWRPARHWYWRQVAGFSCWLVAEAMGRYLRSGGGRHPQLNGGDQSMLYRTLDAFRSALRALWRSPGFALAALLTLAIGIGANTLLFSVVNTILIQPLAYPDADRLVVLREVIPEVADRYPTLPVNAGHLRTWLANSSSLEDAAALGKTSLNLTGQGEPKRLETARVTWNLFSLLGIPMKLGRPFLAEEDQPAAPAVAILSESLWRNAFHADPGVLGKGITLNGVSHEVVGVMPLGIFLPRSEQLGALVDLGEGMDLMVPMRFTENDLEPVGDHNYAAIARLRPGVSYEQASAELDTLQKGIAAGLPFKMGLQIRVLPLQQQLVRDVEGPLWILLAAVAAVLLIGVVNLANLMLARTSARQGEVALRMALGARPRWIVLQVLGESLTLSVLGGALGLLLAQVGMGLLLKTVPIDLPRLGDVGIDLRVVFFGVLLSVVAGFIFGLLPAFSVAGVDPQQSLHTVGQRGTESRRGMTARSGLVAAEIALSTVLLVVAGLLTTSFVKLSHVDRGFVVENLSSVELQVSTVAYPTGRDRIAFYDSVLERVSQVASVNGVALSNALPLTGNSTVDIANLPDDPRPLLERPLANYRWVSPGYFDILQVPLRSGRDFGAGDREQSVAIVSEKLARELWGERDPLGQQFWRGGQQDDGPGAFPFRVVGVVADTRSINLWEDPAATVYLPYWEQGPTESALIVRSRTALPPSEEIRRAIWSVSPEMPVSRLLPLEQTVVGSLELERFQSWLVGAFAVVALLLASFGIYAVISQVVSLRTREIGVRMALGAGRSDILRLVVWLGMVPSLVGLTAGTIGGILAARATAHLLFGTGAADYQTFALALSVLAAVSIFSCYLPARRAARFDPMRILRQ